MSSCLVSPSSLHSFPTRRSSDLGGHDAAPNFLHSIRDGDWITGLNPYQNSSCHALHSTAYWQYAQLMGTSLGTTRSSDRKSTRLNSSHLGISYAVFCLKKKKQSQ